MAARPSATAREASCAGQLDAKRGALSVARERGVRLIVNDRADVALALGADGVHLGQDDLPPEAARRLLGDDAIIGCSTHSVAQARRAARLPVDYVAIGPIFQTSSKENPDPVVGLDGLRRVRAEVGAAVRLVAIGGITRHNIADTLRAGADSAALSARCSRKFVGNCRADEALLAFTLN